MDDELLRLECLDRALEQGLTGEKAMAMADDIFAWIKGRRDGETIGGGRAKVVGRDGDLGKFTDYVKE